MLELYLTTIETGRSKPVRDTPRPRPTQDLDTVEEIAEMVRRFYADVAMDDLLGPVFEDVAEVDWSEHSRS